MNLFLVLVFLFFMGCITGWCLEVFYRRFKKSNVEKKWINPGFMVGPYLPIYGFGLCTLFLLAYMENELNIFHYGYIVNKIILFVLMAIFMTLIELIAGIIFISGMNIKLWDYSNEKFNYKGIICLRFSVYWAFLSAVYYFLIHPHILDALAWFSKNIAFSFVLGVFVGVMCIDFCYSFNLIAKVRKFALDNDILIKYEELKDNIRKANEERKEKYKFLFPFRSQISLSEHLKRYNDLRQAFKNK